MLSHGFYAINTFMLVGQLFECITQRGFQHVNIINNDDNNNASDDGIIKLHHKYAIELIQW